MPITFNNGADRSVVGVTYGDSGVNRTITEAWYGDGGTNRLVFAAVNLQGLDPTDVAVAPTDATATYSLTNAGAETATGVASGTWLTAGSASDYEVRATIVSGTVDFGTTGSWLSLGTTRSWQVICTSNFPDSKAATLTIDIRLASSGAVVATASVILTASVIS